jgi:hypothetical protein
MTLIKSTDQLTIIFAQNALHRETWQRFDSYTDLTQFLLKEVSPLYNGHFPQSGKIYQEFITKDHDITPATPADAEDLSKVTGTIYVVIWPAAQALAIQAAVYVGMFLVTTLLKKVLDTPDEKGTSRNIPTGSPNNLPGQRKNTARVLQRIPDIYGQVKCTPDLLQYPYISYTNNLQSETILACIGVGEYLVEEDQIFEGQTPVAQIPGLSLAIYAPNTVPVVDAPQLQIGPDIIDPLLTVIPVREVTGEQLLAPNNTYIFGEDDQHTTPDYDDETNVATMFTYPSTGVGKIIFLHSNHERSRMEGPFYFTNRLNVGDKFGLRWQGNATGLPDAMTARGSVSIDRHALEMGAGGDAEIPDLELLPLTADDDHYEVTAVSVDTNYLGPPFIGGRAVEYTISVPASKQAEWDKIILFNPTQIQPTDAPVGYMFNRMCMAYVLNFRLGPFFCNDPNMEEIHLNFIADKGLWIDDGKRQLPYGVADFSLDPSAIGGIEITIEVTPADEDGVAIGAKELFTAADGIVMHGSSFKRDFIGNTFKIIPSFSGPFLIAVYRNTLQYWRTQSFAWFATNQRPGFREEKNWAEASNTIFGAEPVPHLYQFADDIKWTHCYSVSQPKYYPFTDPLESLGNVTLVHAKTTQVKFAPQKEFEKNLNMIVTRAIPFWDGDSFPSQEPTTRGLDAAFHVMRTYYIGNVDDENIDFESVEQAFSDVFQAFGNVEATEFNHTFDSEQASFEDILNAIGDACFVTFYRQGDMIKASADVSKPNATLLFNHRNIVQGTQTFNVGFGTEEDYDGVELEYSDNLDNQLKTYLAQIGQFDPRNTQKIRVAGVRTRFKAALHAWRAAHKLQFQNMVAEFDSCEEAALSIVKDKVLVANVNDTTAQNGDIIRIDGLTVYTSQEVNVNPSFNYTLFIQDVDGSVQALPVVTDDTVHGLVLDGAPSATLVIDADAGIYPRYTLVSSQDRLPSAFHIKETQYKNRGVYSVIATNYTEGFYFYDAIKLWLPFTAYGGFPPVLRFFDRGPNENSFEEFGTPSTIVDDDRQIVYVSPDTSTYLVYEDFSGNTLQDYTVAFWIKLVAYGGTVFRGDTTNPNALVLTASFADTEFKLFHDGVEYATLPGVPVDEWHHIGFTYDNGTEIVRIYLDGEEESTAIDVPGFDSFDGLRVFQVNGRGDDFRIYNKVKTADFMRALYQKSLNPLF